MMHLEQALIEAATTQGIWVLLFVSLFLYKSDNNESNNGRCNIF